MTHCLDNRLTDCGKVVSPTNRPRFTSPETLLHVGVLIVIFQHIKINYILSDGDFTSYFNIRIIRV
jgi:hypothetical protein